MSLRHRSRPQNGPPWHRPPRDNVIGGVSPSEQFSPVSFSRFMGNANEAQLRVIKCAQSEGGMAPRSTQASFKVGMFKEEILQVRSDIMRTACCHV